MRCRNNESTDMQRERRFRGLEREREKEIESKKHRQSERNRRE